jgi:hypothetical protein
MKIFTFLLLLFSTFSSCKNNLVQTEKRAKSAEIPNKVIDFIHKTYPNHEKIKFYKETENDTLYYEANFEQEEDEYSLLFDKLGNLYETEITLKFKELPAEIQQKVENYLKTNFVKYKIKKTQEVDLQGKLLYELAIKAKKTNENGFYEIYFDRQGNFIKMEIIKLNAIQSLY